MENPPPSPSANISGQTSYNQDYSVNYQKLQPTQGYNGPNLPTRSLLSISLKSWVLSESRTTIASGVVENPHNQPWVK